MSNIRPLPPPPSDMPPPTSPTLALDPIQNSLFEDSPPGPGTAGAEEESQDIEAPKKRRSQRRAEGEETEENSQGPAARNSKPNTRGATSSKRNKKKNLDPNPTLPSFDDQPDPLSQSQTFMPELVVVPSDPHGYMAMCGLTPLTPGMSTIEDRARIAENEVKVAGFVASMVGRINKLQNEVIPKVSNTSSKAAAALDGRLSGQISKVEGSVNVLRDEMGLAKDQNDLALAQLSKDVHAKVDEGHADMLRWRDQKNEVITNFSHRLNALTAANETRRASNAIVGSGSAVALSPLAGDLSNNQAASSSHAMPARSQASSNRYAPYPRSANRAPPADEEVCVLYGPHPTLPDNSGNPLHPLRSIINALDLPTARGSDVRSVYKSSPSANTFVVTFVGRRQAEEFESKINSLSRDGRAPYHGATAKLISICTLSRVTIPSSSLPENIVPYGPLVSDSTLSPQEESSVKLVPPPEPLDTSMDVYDGASDGGLSYTSYTMDDLRQRTAATRVLQTADNDDPDTDESCSGSDSEDDSDGDLETYGVNDSDAQDEDPLTRPIRIASWNVGGNLAVNIRRPELIKVIKDNTITFFQETWLAQQMEMPLAIPNGFKIMNCARRWKRGGRLPGGGVLAIVSMAFESTFRDDLSGGDICVIELQDLYIINVYLPPITSKWEKWTDVSPMDTLAQVAALCTNENISPKPIIVIGDLNGRLRSEQNVEVAALYPRCSSDKLLNSRGSWLMETLINPLDLMVVNGTSLEEVSPGAMTSFQPQGSSVIDYVLISATLAPCINYLRVSRPHSPGRFYDHGLVELSLEVALTRPSTPPGTSRAQFVPPPMTSPLDLMLQDVMGSTLSDDEAVRRFYGPVHTVGKPIIAYIAANRSSHGRFTCAVTRTQAVAEVISVDGFAKDAVLAGIAWVALHADPERTLVLFLDSDPAIRALAYDLGPLYLKGGLDEESPLARVGYILRRRLAPTSLVPIKDSTRGVVPWKAAVDNARSPKVLPTAFSIPAVDDESLPVWPDPTAPPLLQVEFSKCKVYTSIPPKPKQSISKRTVSDLRKAASKGPPPLDVDKTADAHRGRASDRKRKWWNMQILIEACMRPELWDIFRGWSDPKRRPLAIPLPKVVSNFRTRMNPPNTLPAIFAKTKYDEDAKRAAELPDCTVDISPSKSFERLVDISEVLWVKKRIKTRPKNSACGIDGTPYTTILSMDNEKLRDLFNECIRTRKAPTMWTTSTLVAILKPNKPSADPDSYRIVGLQCCLQKCFTLIIDHRFKEYLDDTHLLPDSQNGFREGYRTNNNAFILRHCVDKAVADKNCLAAVFVDLKNAFPSTNLPTLWTKLYDAGARGPMIDWMRMLYGQMEYRVKSDGEYSEAFQSLWGILAGDSLSPSFFDAYIHDFKPPTLPSDIVLQGTPIGNMELADDIVEFTQLDRKRPDLAALQPKVHYTEVEYCARQVFFEMSVPKTRGLLFGATGEPISSLTVADGTPIIFDDKYRYGGVLFSNTVGSRLFTPHYTFQADRARNAIYSLFAAEAYTGTIPIQVGLVLYRARVDCHLTYGCEVVIDVSEAGIRKLEKEQKRCLRRLNGVGPRSPTAPLFTETGIMPIRHRRIILALRFAQYALEEPLDHWVSRAYRDTLAMHRAGKKGWMRDMVRALAKLPFAPVTLDVSSMESVDGISAVITQVEISCSKYLMNELASTRLPLLHGEDRGLQPDSIQSTLRLRPYLRNVTIPAHRKALFRFLCADHYLAVEQYRRVPRRNGDKIPVDQRPCRYGDACTESEVHALFLCNGIDKLVDRRTVFMDRIKAMVPSHTPEFIRDNPILCIHFYLEHKELAPILAKFVYDIMVIFPGPERSKGPKGGKKRARKT